MTVERKEKKEFNKNVVWELVGYATLLTCVFGQIAVGYWYLVAQFVYLVANVATVVRDFALDLPQANKVKDICFTGITVALIGLYLF